MVDGFSCSLDFPNFSGGGPPDPPYKGNTSIKPSKIFLQQQQQPKAKKEPERSPLKQPARNLPLGYTEIKKGGGRWGKIFFVWFVFGLFATLICAIAEDDVCDSCIVSFWALLIFLLCLWWPNSNFLCCVITQNRESSHDLLLSVTNRKALAPGRTATQSSPLKHLLHYYQSLSHHSTRIWVLVGGERLVLW